MKYLKYKGLIKKITIKFIPMVATFIILYFLDIYVFKRDTFRISYLLIIIITSFLMVSISCLVNKKK